MPNLSGNDDCRGCSATVVAEVHGLPRLLNHNDCRGFFRRVKHYQKDKSQRLYLMSFLLFILHEFLIYLLSRFHFMDSLDLSFPIKRFSYRASAKVCGGPCGPRRTSTFQILPVVKGSNPLLRRRRHPGDQGPEAVCPIVRPR